jgi:aminoglycoside 3-N-acetyltransferase
MPNLSDLQLKAKRVLHRLRTPIRPEQMRTTLNRLIGDGSEILFVHASLSSCGRFTAGPGDVLCGLHEICDTLAFPTQTYCYPSSPGEVGPLFDPETTPSKTGLLTEIFRTQTGTLRSIHATHSLAASGALAEEICSGHYRHRTPCGAGTPYNRLVERRAAVLLFGVTFHCYTLFHTAEDASGSEFAYERGRLDRLRVVDERGDQHDCWSRRQSRVSRRFEEAGGLLESVGLARRVTLGRADLLYVPNCSAVHDFLVERLRKTPDFLHQSCTTPLR